MNFENVTRVEYEYHDTSKPLKNLETEIRSTKIDETGALNIV